MVEIFVMKLIPIIETSDKCNNIPQKEECFRA
jgi:hypothetical protein